MTDRRTQEQADRGNMEKDPGDWTTGEEPMPGAQRTCLKTLSEEAKIEFDDALTKAEVQAHRRAADPPAAAFSPRAASRRETRVASMTGSHRR